MKRYVKEKLDYRVCVYVMFCFFCMINLVLYSVWGSGGWGGFWNF